MQEVTRPKGDQESEEALSIEDRRREEVERVLRAMGDGDADSALALLRELHPADQGEALLELGPELWAGALSRLTAKEIAEVLEHLDLEEALVLTSGIDPRLLPHVLDETRQDVAADILRRLPLEQSQETLDAMMEAEDVSSLLGYADETAGGLMLPEFPVVSDHMSAGIALDVLRILGPDAEEFSSIFVVDDEVKLLGSVTVTRLALSPLNAVVRDIMHPEIISVPAETDQEECARLMERYNLRHLPVLDHEERLIGIIQLEDVVDVVTEEATEDMYRIAGITGERVMGPLAGSVRSRLPWLFINLGTAFLAALVISFFESTIARVAALAIFLPVVAGTGGHSRDTDPHTGGSRHGPGWNRQAHRPPACGARAVPGAGERAASGGGGGPGGLCLEGDSHAGRGGGRGHAGQHGSCGSRRKQCAALAA